MQKVKIMDVSQERQFIDKDSKNQKNKKKHEKFIKINNSLFEIGLRKGLIEKNEDGYYFIGDYEELLAFKNNSSFDSFELLD
ncbi:MAG: hypothetical protein KAH91_00740 [Thermoplasmatales archaeon]|nr:hypothetical protein [Thermoplasmatales archaeon]